MKITKSQKLELQKLRGKAVQLQKQIDEIYMQALEITQENLDGYTFDYIFNPTFIDLEELLEKLRIKTEKFSLPNYLYWNSNTEKLYCEVCHPKHTVPSQYPIDYEKDENLSRFIKEHVHEYTGVKPS